MPDGFIDMRLAGGIEWRALIRDLKAQSRGELGRKLRRNIRRAAGPVINDLRAAVLRVNVTADPASPTPGRSYGNREHLRERVARAITLSMTTKGVRIRVSAQRIGPYGASLAKYLDAEITQYQRWRHPVFGHDVWAVQHGQPWFFNTISNHKDELRRAVLDAIDETKRELSG